MSAKLSLDQTIMKAKFHVKKGEMVEAEKLYQLVLQAFPKNLRVQQELATLNKTRQNNVTESPPQKVIDQLVHLYNQRQFSVVVDQAQEMINRYPDAIIIWNILGASAVQIRMLDKAIEAYNKAILLKPDYAEAYSNLGNALQDQGELDKAIEACNKAISLKPDYAEAYNNLGNALKDQGKLDEALEVYNKAISLKPDYAEAYSNLGNALQDQGELDKAIKVYKKALSLKPSLAVTYNNLGNALKNQGKLDEAIKACNEAILLKPNYIEAYNNLGVILKDQGKLDKAIEACNKAILLKPDYAEAYITMGNAYKDQGKLDVSIKIYKKALLLNPYLAESYNNLGNALLDQGKLDKAIEACNKAILIKPDYAEAYNNLGNAFISEGKRDEAIEFFKKSILLKPDLSGAHRNLSALVTYKANNPQINTVNQLLKRTTLNNDNRCHLLYTFGKMKEDIGDYGASFENYVNGGALRKKLLKYNLKQDELLFSKIKNAAEILENFSFNVSLKAKENYPIFIVGMPRSGTTLVEQIISSHSKVQGAGELTFVNSFGSSIATGSKPLTTGTLTDFIKAYLKSLAKVSNNYQFVTDKMPHNFLYLGLILKVFPEVKIIHVNRDPMATCWSNFKHYFPVNGLGYSYDLGDTVEYFKLYKDLMILWNDLYPDRIYQLNYEKLTIEQNTETRKLIDYLELNWDEICLSPHKNKRIVRTASSQQVREKIYKGSSESWRKFEPYLKNVFHDLINY